METGEKGKSLIKKRETLRLVAYLPTAHDVWTIGWGHTSDVNEGDTCTVEQADAWLSEDLAWVETCINKYVRVGVTQNEFDALASFVFKLGCANFKTSTLLKKINEHDFVAAEIQFQYWNKQRNVQTGQYDVLNGLTARREDERALFAS